MHVTARPHMESFVRIHRTAIHPVQPEDRLIRRPSHPLRPHSGAGELTRPILLDQRPGTVHHSEFETSLRLYVTWSALATVQTCGYTPLLAG
jgi:hypothetical protein